MNFDVPPSINSPEKSDGEQTIDRILGATLYNEWAKERRRKVFDQAWEERYKRTGGKDGYFQTNEQESPFEKYSSKGWKIHIAFLKGKEKEIAQVLYENGLCFKVEAGIGTYFNGLKESGATIYIGSHDNMEAIADLIENKLGAALEDGSTAKVGDKVIRVGSSSDIEVRPKVTARFDVAKTAFGWFSGNKKYSEHGLPTWTKLGGIPSLAKYGREISDVTQKWNKMSQYQRDIYMQRFFKRIYKEAKDELIKDFGEKFLEGSKKN